MQIHYKIKEKCNDKEFNVITFTLSSGDKIIQKYVDKNDYLKTKKETFFFNFNEKLNKIIFDKIRYDQINSGATSIEITKWSKVNRIIFNIFDSDKKFHAINVPTGAGKTAIFIQRILYIIKHTANLKMRGIDSIIILAPNYDNAIDEITNQIEKFVKFNTSVIILEGKYRTCKYNPKAKINKNNHNMDATINEAIKIGLPIKSICDKDGGECKKTCKFYNNLNNIKSENGIKFIITTQHQLKTNTFPILMKKLKKILIIIDENFKDAIRTDFDITLKNLEENIKFLKEFMKNEPMDGDLINVAGYRKKSGTWVKAYSYTRKSTMDEYTIEDLKWLLKLLEFFSNSINDGIDYNELEDIMFEVVKFADTLPLLSRRAWFVYKKENKLPLRSFLFYNIKDYIDNYNFQILEKSGNIDNWLKNSIQRIDNTTTNSKYISFKYFEQSKVERVVNNDKIIKILNTDATAIIKNIEILFNHEIEEHYLPGLYSNNIYAYQLKQESQKGIYPYALFSKQTINSYTSFSWLKKDLKAIVDAFDDIEDILLLSQEMMLSNRHYQTDLWEYLKQRVSPKFKCEPFGLASTNRYENYIVVIALGTPLISSIDNEREARLLGRDPIETWLERARNKIKQGIGRPLRGIHDVYIFILNGLDLELDFPIKKIYKRQITDDNGIPRWQCAHDNLIRIVKKLKEKRKKEIETIKLLDFIKNNNNQINREEYALIINKDKRIAGTILNKFVKEEIIYCRTEERGRKVFYIKDKLEKKLEKYIEEFTKPFIT